MNKKMPLKNLILIAVFGAIAFILMMFDFPLLFIAPSFYKLDFSEVPALVGAFAMGPVAGVLIELLKVLLEIVFRGTTTAYVGELGNFIMGCAMIVPAAIIYRKMHTLKGAVIAMISGTVIMAAAGCIVNAELLLPWYANNMFGSMDPIMAAGQAIHPSIDGVYPFVVMLVAPFNLVKGALVSVLTALLYKRISILIKRF